MTPEQYVQDKAAASGSSFYYAFLFLPKPRRAAITAFYAFCREIDDVVDEVSDPGVAATKLAWWRTEVAQSFAGPPRHPVMQALVPHAATYGIEPAQLNEVIDGCQMDLEQTRYLDFPGLARYCHLVAGVVGEVAARIFGQTDPQTTAYAHKLGLALQLTNIIRDVGEDALRGRIYLPVNELQKFDVKAHEILNRVHSERFVVRRVGALGLELHQCDETIGVHAVEDLVRLHVELLQFVHGQVDASAQGVLAHVAQDVGELQRQAELVGIGGGLRIGLAEDARRDFADHAGHQVAVARKAGKVEIPGLLQVHLAAVDHFVELACLDAVGRGMRHQRLHHWMARRACERLGDLGAPPGELGGGHAGVGDLVDHVVDLAAERIEGRDRGAARLGQEEEGVVEAAARGRGFFLDVLFWGHR